MAKTTTLTPFSQTPSLEVCQREFNSTPQEPEPEPEEEEEELEELPAPPPPPPKGSKESLKPRIFPKPEPKFVSRKWLKQQP